MMDTALRNRCLVVTISIASVCCGSFGAERAAWTTSRIKGSPEPPSPYQTEIAFPKLKFDEPVDMTLVPGSNRMVVVERFGLGEIAFA